MGQHDLGRRCSDVESLIHDPEREYGDPVASNMREFRYWKAPSKFYIDPCVRHWSNAFLLHIMTLASSLRRPHFPVDEGLQRRFTLRATWSSALIILY